MSVRTIKQCDKCKVTKEMSPLERERDGWYDLYFIRNLPNETGLSTATLCPTCGKALGKLIATFISKEKQNAT